MKNYEQILSEAGVTLTDEQKETIKKEMEENYKTISDWEKQRDRADGFEKTLKDTQEKLKELNIRYLTITTVILSFHLPVQHFVRV